MSGILVNNSDDLISAIQKNVRGYLGKSYSLPQNSKSPTKAFLNIIVSRRNLGLDSLIAMYSVA
jgi:hypothetical protein